MLINIQQIYEILIYKLDRVLFLIHTYNHHEYRNSQAHWSENSVWYLENQIQVKSALLSGNQSQENKQEDTTE